MLLKVLEGDPMMMMMMKMMMMMMLADKRTICNDRIDLQLDWLEWAVSHQRSDKVIWMILNIVNDDDDDNW